MKIFLTFILIGVTAFAKAQTLNPELLQNTRHLEDVTGNEYGLADVDGTPAEGSIMYDSPTNRAFLYDGSEWRRIYLSPKVDAKTASYTLQASDDGNVLTFNSATDVVLTIPAGLERGFNVSVYQEGTGQVQVEGGAGVTIKNRLSRFFTAGVGAGIGIIAIDDDSYNVTGDLKKS